LIYETLTIRTERGGAGNLYKYIGCFSPTVISIKSPFIHYSSHETGQAIGHLIPSRRAHKSLSRLSLKKIKIKQLPGSIMVALSHPFLFRNRRHNNPCKIRRKQINCFYFHVNEHHRELPTSRWSSQVGLRRKQTVFKTNTASSSLSISEFVP
jgi:hypothetical protein